ncbi:GvpL/GvpF family gas vesicle protein [Rubrimonas cliftonensis]|uniref:Gas vesicle synthesis protein GvpL/GvpF n=1 Tax=Rubrimonas cliftonensis TaxID=89524 RepID=A0A1H4ALL9_9RHOB|nr:GvpL/GvpF family gas vesicle protein [Rubrimonas cliftonensis]SEA36859.1 Gas vesicle synthesis protein GvpL/GvpF [Rubrimonas cliftonensis]
MTAALILLGAARAADAAAIAAAGLTLAQSGPLAAVLDAATEGQGAAGARVAATARAAAAAGAFAPVHGGRFSIEAARAWLDAEAEALSEALARLADQAEWVLTLSLPPRAAADATPAAGEPSDGRAWLRARAAAHGAEARDRRRAEADAAAALAGVARETRARGFDTAAGRGVDVAVLAPRGAGQRVEAAARGLGAGLTGPWPAFSFVAAAQGAAS